MEDLLVSYAVNFVVDNRTPPENVVPFDPLLLNSASAPTGDIAFALTLFIGIIAILISAFVVFRNVLKYKFATAEKSTSTGKINSKKLSMFKIVFGILIAFTSFIFCLTFTSNVQKSYAETQNDTINAHIDYNTGQIGFDTMEFSNATVTALKVKTSNIKLSNQMQQIPGLADAYININGFDGVIYEGPLAQKPQPVKDAYGHVNSKSTSDITLSLDGIGKNEALSLEGMSGFSIEFCFEDCVLPDPVVTSEFTYTGVEYTGVTCDSTHVTLVDDKGKDADTYSCIATPEKGFIWKDESPIGKICEWKILPAELTVVTESADKTYNGESLRAGGTIEGFVEVDGVYETATFNVNGEITDVGTVPNTYEIIWNGTAKECNYTVNENLGTLEVTKAKIQSIYAENVQEFVYTGEPQSGVVEATKWSSWSYHCYR